MQIKEIADLAKNTYKYFDAGFNSVDNFKKDVEGKAKKWEKEGNSIQKSFIPELKTIASLADGATGGVVGVAIGLLDIIPAFSNFGIGGSQSATVRWPNANVELSGTIQTEFPADGPHGFAVHRADNVPSISMDMLEFDDNLGLFSLREPPQFKVGPDYIYLANDLWDLVEVNPASEMELVELSVKPVIKTTARNYVWLYDSSYVQTASNDRAPVSPFRDYMSESYLVTLSYDRARPLVMGNNYILEDYSAREDVFTRETDTRLYEKWFNAFYTGKPLFYYYEHCPSGGDPCSSERGNFPNYVDPVGYSSWNERHPLAQIVVIAGGDITTEEMVSYDETAAGALDAYWSPVWAPQEGTPTQIKPEEIQLKIYLRFQHVDRPDIFAEFVRTYNATVEKTTCGASAHSKGPYKVNQCSSMPPLKLPGFAIDSDGDGLLDGQEDLNHNGVLDVGETDPSTADTDNDGMPDNFEVTYGLDPQVNDAILDLDNDGLSNITEYELGANPTYQDTDHDSVNDGDEYFSGRNPTVNEPAIMVAINSLLL